MHPPLSTKQLRFSSTCLLSKLLTMNQKKTITTTKPTMDHGLHSCQMSVPEGQSNQQVLIPINPTVGGTGFLLVSATYMKLSTM